MSRLGEQLSESDVEAMIRAVDRNDDGKVDYEGLSLRVASVFALYARVVRIAKYCVRIVARGFRPQIRLCDRVRKQNADPIRCESAVRTETDTRTLARFHFHANGRKLTPRRCATKT